MKATRYFAIFAIVTALCTTAAAAPMEASDRLSMQLEDVDIPVVLNMIAEQYDLNVVISGEVSGTVSLRLDNVALESALEAILSPNGYNYYLRNDVIIVKPMDMTAPGELVSETVTLNYLDPGAARKALESRKSEKGTVLILDNDARDKTDRDTYTPNRIMITDLPTVVSELVAMIKAIDIPERLVSIEVKIIETKRDVTSELGFAWPTSITTSLGASDDSDDGSTTSGTGKQNVAGELDLESGRWTWGRLTVDEMQVVLDILNREGNSRLISDPHLTTLENHQAEIKVETVIPIPTVNRFTEAASTMDILTFQDEEVGITLKVTPRISEGNRITLDVFPQVQDIIGMAGPADNQKPITASRSVRTRVTVNDGETVALGGLLEESEIQTIHKVPLLGSIPFLGRLLFTNEKKETGTTDLIILITPRIMP